MAIDTSIYGLAGKVKSVADYDREALLADEARQQQKLTAMQIMTGQQKQQEYMRGVQRADALRQLAGRWKADTTDEQRIVDLKNAGFAQEADAAEKAFLERQKTGAEVAAKKAATTKADLDNQITRMGTILNVISGAKDQGSYTQGRATLAQAGFDVSQVPEQFDPAYVSAAGQQALTALQRMQEERARLAAEETVRHNKAGEALTQRGQDVGAATARRGQDMANERAREGNAIQRDLAAQQRQLAVNKAQDEEDARNRKKDAAVAAITDRVAAIDKALTHPGRETATGLSSVLDPRNAVPGTDAMNFKALSDQISGAAFLEAFESLKGGGAITEVEGKKAEQAVARLNRAQSDDEYAAALNDLRSVMATGYKRMTGKELPNGGPKRIQTDAEYDALPSGTEFIDPKGQKRRKP